MEMIGERLREVRETRGLSLTDVATKAHISAATLSRIENSKQGLDFGLFLILAKVLAVAPTDLVVDESGDGHDPLVAKIAQLSTSDRVRLWRDLADARRNSRQKRHARHSDTVSQQMEELFAQFEYVREELEAVRTSFRKRGRGPRLTVSLDE
ncbi:MAG TPA: helix-turn-helix transcriptional regulator [Thermoanaerobaculia bacterium]|jgi:transcriptional regulator with XRE-family HTH domain|nr:helix-turn-helix transcriptional regulator [Thermoanaerobaculia bacterium]